MSSRRSRLRPLVLVLLLLGTSAAVVAPLRAQQNPELEKQRKRLEEIRQERERLQRQQQQIEGQVSDVGSQLRNLERRKEATTELVTGIEREISTLGSQLERTSAELTLTQDNLADRQAVLRRRLVDIYKRGPLYTFQVLLAAESFGDLLTRYKYLYLTSQQDRNLVRDVEKLSANVTRRRNDLLGIKTELDHRRAEREAELDNYARLADERQSRLKALERTSTQGKQRLTTLERDENRLNDILAALEKARRAAEANRAARPTTVNAPSNAGSLTTADLGKLDWPVEGEIIYDFGRDSLKNGGVVRHNGIGIKAAVGTPVKVIEAGKVVLAQRLSTYGLAVFIEHGDGYYSGYMQLQNTSVRVGQEVTRGQVIGTVGGENSGEGPHLYFEIRGKNQIALDPTSWLRRRSGQ
ncbi:MAG: peptidoglycan DD-metalloendopeptidase family protein [Gemmatimonadota bacterium]